MFGLEKKPQAVFEMDLERDLKKDPDKAQEMLKATEKKILEIKSLLREGAKGAEFDNLGTLLHGYTALIKVINRIVAAKKKGG